MEFSTFGRHVVLDTWGVDFDRLNNTAQLETQMRLAAEKCGATVLSTQCKNFAPQGVTVLVLLSESHLSIHTYPEKGFAALDCFTCGQDLDPMIAIRYLLDVLEPKQTFVKVMRRGDGPIEWIQPEWTAVKTVI